MSNIEDYIEYILKKHGEDVDELSVQIYVNEIGNRIAIRIKDGYSLKLLTADKI